MDYDEDEEFGELCIPFLKAWEKAHEKTAKWIYIPFEKLGKSFCELPNAELWFCGCCAILVPFIAAFLLLFITVQLFVFVTFGLFGFSLGMFFVFIGIWPAFINAFSITGITIITLPKNIYYHILITYRTVMLRRNVKILSFMLLPFTHLLIPPVTFIVALIIFLPWYILMSFAGSPYASWKDIKRVNLLIWKKFTKDAKKIADNYGHSSGIPENWDGTVYGLAVDPVVIIVALFLYVMALFYMTPVMLTIFAIKALPIFLCTLKEFSKTVNLCKSASWYFGVLAGTHVDNSTNRNQNRSNRQPRTQTGHDGWIACWKDATKGIKKFIEGYAHIKIFKIYSEILEEYLKSIKEINPTKLGKLVKSYCTDFNPMKICPEEIDASIIILWIPMSMVFAMWTLGFILVLIIPPATFIAVFILWILLWPIVIVLPPVLYIFGWISIIFGLPILYVIVWCLILTLPWIFSGLGLISGPFLALAVPFAMLYHNNYNPIDMWANAKRSLIKGHKIVKSADRWTATLSICDIRIFPGNFSEDSNTEAATEEDTGPIDYWELYVDRCIKESKIIQTRKWISPDDVMALSSTATVAVPGVAIVAILEDTVKRNKDDKNLLIYWNEHKKCRHSNRDLKDNVANVFLPQIMKVKEFMMHLKDDVGNQINWVKASLCDGEDEKSEELQAALDAFNGNREMCLKIRASVENIVYSLHRVDKMRTKMPQIFSATIEDDEV